MNDVNEMMQLGFSQEDCIEAYISCDWNKELAMNLLLDTKFG